MCGVPVHSPDMYLERLIQSGAKVAICEQMEDPAEAKKRGGYKAIVQRDVVRIVTPGTLTEETLLDARQSNYLAGLADAGTRMALPGWIFPPANFRRRRASGDACSPSWRAFRRAKLLLPDTLA